MEVLFDREGEICRDRGTSGKNPLLQVAEKQPDVCLLQVARRNPMFLI